MKKKLLAMLFSGAIAFGVFVVPGNEVQAKKIEVEPCDCHTPIFGVERNKIVAELLSNEEFKAKKVELTDLGYKWQGSALIEVVKFNETTPVPGTIAIAIPFKNKNGVIEYATYLTGIGFFPELRSR
ncbi:hypothetical protein A8F94_21745 [Bacillus sp. FJAT-27225]|uniref:hypothetical protein n=1 Tax=Bacillus sp. FJAT-27225 TaxID=1743144 RepID=UPI00080C2C2D|nr:hypothetical protein [Bacillus sp. FJAT-27225]OCA81504.1 hypothetical protein A8F94_21745 [Bacillus sp. FJAT-27225]